LTTNAKRKEVRKRYKVLAVVILLGLGVFYLYPATPKEKHDKYYALWKSHHIESYAYTLQGGNHATGPVSVRVVVRNKKIINRYEPASTEKSVDRYLPAYTIENKFNSIGTHAYKNIVSYDKTYGYPKYDSYFPNLYDDGNLILGGGYKYQIKNFRILPVKISDKYHPVCSEHIIVKPCMHKVCPVLKSYDKTYNNKDMMNMAGAYFKYEGECKSE
jgi:hypothetical protein